MKNVTRCLVISLSLAVVAGLSRGAESPSVLLQKGIYAEETESNLDSAIKIYEQIAAEAATNRGVVAQAQYRLAVCYQKKGNRGDAIRALNELLQQTAADSDIAQRARDSLAELGQMPAPVLGIRKLSIPDAAYVWSGNDGRYIPISPLKPNRSDLVIYDTATGKRWTVEKNPDDWGTWAGPSISPDGKWIAYDREDPQHTRVKLAKIDGSEGRTLIEEPMGQEKDFLDVVGWSRDSTRVLVEYSKAKISTLSAVEIGSGKRTEIFRSAGEQNDWWNLSGDLRYLARCRGQNPRSIVIIDLASGKEEPLVARDANRIFGWFENDSALVYTKNGLRGTELWVAAIKDGKPVGEPQLVWNNFANQTEVLPRGIGRNGNVYYHLGAGQNAGDWVMEGFLPRALAVMNNLVLRPEIAISLSEITGPDNSVLDRKSNVSFKAPANWKVRSAVLRGNGATLVALRPIPEIEGASTMNVAYRAMSPWDNSVFSVFPLKDLTPQPTTPTEVDDWLRSFARSMERQRVEGNLANASYKNRPNSFQIRTVGSNRVASWAGDYNDSDNQTEYFTVLCGKTAVSWIWFRAPTAKIAQVDSALEELVKSMRLP